MKRIYSPVVRGSGVEVVHGELQAAIPGYSVKHYSPWLEYMPWRFIGMREPAAAIVHTPIDYAHLFAGRGQKSVATLHNYFLDRPYHRHVSLKQKIHYRTDLRYFTRKAAARADRLTAVSHFLARLAAYDLPTDKSIEVIHNGVDEKRFFPKPRAGSNRLTLGFSGNFSRRKGASMLLAIAPQLPRGIDIMVTAEADSVPAQASNIRAAGHIAHHKMPEFYHAIDILLCPSIREGYSLAVAEAMSCGLPVIASDAGGIPELLTADGGALCPVDSVTAFVDAIVLLADNPTLRQQQGEYNRQRIIEQFTLARMVARYRALFDSL